MQTSSLLFCVLSVSFIAAAYGGQLIAVHPTGLEVDATDDSVTLQCTATNEGEISHWLLNGARLDPASLSGVDVTTTAGAGGSSTLSISSYQPAVHAGEYRCVARLLEGEMLMEVSHAAPVSHFTQRTFTTEPQDFPVYSLPPLPGAESATPSREAAAFNCEFSALPRFGRRPVIVWEYESASTGNATVLDLSGSTTMSSFQYDHIGYFQLHSPKEFDDGSRVRCLARHPDDPSQQVESQWATIVISNSSRPADFPVFTTQMPSQMHRIDGQQLVMGCSKSTPITSTNLQWVGEVPSEGVAFLTAGIQLIIVRNDVVAYGSSNVLIPDVSIDDVINQTFTCRAVLDLQVFEWTTTIIPPPPPLPPLMYNDQHSAGSIDYGAPGINLEARNYSGRVAWWVNGAPIPSDGSSQKYTISSDMLTLTIRDIVLNDSGLYQADLIDAQPPQLLNFQISVRGDRAFVFPGADEPLTVDFGSPSVLFDCPTAGNVPPVTSYSWSFNGAQISHDGSKYIVHSNGSLAVNNIQLSDAGTYSCAPQNALGNFNSTSVTLTINGDRAFVLPGADEPITVDVGSPSVLFDCPTEGNVPPITSYSWSFNGAQISHDGSKYIVHSNGSLAVNNIQLSDAGIYSCAPQNALGNFNSSSATLTVNGGDRAFVLPGADEPLTVDFGSPSVLFDCPTEGNVPPITSYSWSFNGAQISHNGSKYIVHSNGSLAVNNIQLSDAGTYSCAPQNALGNFNSTSVTLTVNGDRAFVLPGADEPITVDVGSPSVLFDCPTEGNVPPVTSYSWSFNGAQVSHDGSKYVLCPNGSLAVNNIQLSDAGTYSCAPQNALGNFNSSSATLTVNVPRTAPDVPSINHVGIVDETSIFVNWTALDDVDSYTLEIRTSHREKEGEREGEGEGDEDDDEQDVSKNGDSNEGESVKTLDLDTNKHIITDVDFELIYSFRVKATNDIGSSDYSSAYEFDPETALERGHGRERSGLRGWEVALIVIFIILLLLLCCILLLCICLCWRREKRTYYAAKKEKEMQDGGVESYRQTDEPDNKDN